MRLLTTGEFAKLCGTKKDTLFFYDKKGLLKPRHISENGYRRYGVEQFYDFDMIVMLKETGSSLKEIKMHLEERNPDKLLILFEKKQQLIRREKARLERRQKMLRDITTLTREALEAVYDTLQVLPMEEERLELVPIGPQALATATGSVSLVLEYAEYFESRNRVPLLPFVVLSPIKEAVSGQYQDSFFFSGASRATPASQLHIKPRGKYAVMAHKGTGQSHQTACAAMLRMVEESRLRVADSIYSYDMMSYIVAKSTDEYAVRYCVRIL